MGVLGALARRSGQEPYASTVVIPEELRRPQQQAYWLLAGATLAHARVEEPLRERVADLLRYSPNRYGGAPVGALGIPTATMWRAAGWFTDSPDAGARGLADLLGDLARRYEESVRPAMANTYLWENGAAPVDVGNVDIAALTLSGYLVFGEQFEASLRARRESLDDLARVQLDLAMNLAHPEELPA